MSTQRPAVRRLRRGAYLLPSLFTMGNILLGFYAVILGYRGNFYTAAWMIFFAGVLDALDGRIARMTGTESDFGKEFDSLADVLTFGAAPAYLAFLWGLHDLGRIGWLVPFYFLSCTSIRLARFNVQTKSVDSRFFVGVPSPAAAGIVAAFLMFASGMEVATPWLELAMLVLLAVAGSLMVSTFRYPSFKKIDLRKRWSYRSAVLLALLLLLLTFEPTRFFQLAALSYISSGPIGWLIGRVRRRPAADPQPSAEENAGS